LDGVYALAKRGARAVRPVHGNWSVSAGPSSAEIPHGERRCAASFCHLCGISLKLWAIWRQ